MERATPSIRRSGALLLSLGSHHQELNLIISDLKSLKSQIKAMRDTHQTVLQEIWGWAKANENNALKEMFALIVELNKLWTEVQTEFADQMGQFKLNFDMFLEGEKILEATRNELSSCETAEQKAEKKFKKLEKKKDTEEYKTAKMKLMECKRQKELLQNKVTEKVLENEAVKLIRLKNGFLKLSEAYLTLSHKCIYIFEAQRDIVKTLPDVDDKEIHEMKLDGLPGAENIVQRARTYVKEYIEKQQLSQQSAMDPPPPYSVVSPHSNPPFNPYYMSGSHTPVDQPPEASSGSFLYPSLTLPKN